MARKNTSMAAAHDSSRWCVALARTGRLGLARASSSRELEKTWSAWASTRASSSGATLILEASASPMNTPASSEFRSPPSCALRAMKYMAATMKKVRNVSEV